MSDKSAATTQRPPCLAECKREECHIKGWCAFSETHLATEGYPGIAHDFETMRLALIDLDQASLRMAQVFNLSRKDGVSVAEVDKMRQDLDKARAAARAAIKPAVAAPFAPALEAICTSHQTLMERAFQSGGVSAEQFCIGLTPERVEQIAGAYFADPAKREWCIAAINKALREDRPEVERKRTASSAALTCSDGVPSAPLIEVWAVYRQDMLHAVDLTEKKARARRDLMPNADTVKVVRAALSTGRFAAPAEGVAFIDWFSKWVAETPSNERTSYRAASDAWEAASCAQSATGEMKLTPAMIVAGANVEPPCGAGEFIERWRAAVAAADRGA